MISFFLDLKYLISSCLIVMTKTSSTVSLEAVIMAFCFIPNFKEPTHVFTIKCDSSCRLLVDTPKLSKEVPVYSSFPETFIKKEY